MKHNPYQVITTFEELIAEYCGAEYAVAVDNATNGLFLCMKYLGLEDQEITIYVGSVRNYSCWK